MSSDSQELIDYLNTNNDTLTTYQQNHFNYVQGCVQSDFGPKRSTTQQELDNYILQNQHKVMSFIEPQDYLSNNNQNINNNNDNINSNDVSFKLQHAQWQLNRDLYSIMGGQQRNTCNGKATHNGYPLNSENPPQHNIIVAIDQQAYSHGGYYDTSVTAYNDKPHNAHVLVASGIEFETYTLNELHNSPYITQLQEHHQELLDNNNNNNNNNDKDVEKIDLIELKKINELIDNENIEKKAQNEQPMEHLYLDKKAYIKEIKENLIRQLKAAVYAHHQSSNKCKGIEVNLTLPGMGCFANLLGSPALNIKEILAPLAAQAYKEAIEEFDKFNNNIPNGFGKLEKVRLLRSNKFILKASKDSIDEVFFTKSNNNNVLSQEEIEKGVMVGNIRVAANDDYVENFTRSDPNLQQVVMICGDSRAQPGNESYYASQEPGVFAHFTNLRYLMCSHHNKAMLFNTFKNDISLEYNADINNKLSDDEIKFLYGDALTNIITSAQNGLVTYESKFNSFWGKPSKGGKVRYGYYKGVFNDESCSQQEKLVALVALLYSNKGNTLQHCVINQLQSSFNINPKSKNAHTAYAQELAKLVTVLYGNDKLDSDVENHLVQAEDNNRISVGKVNNF